MEPRKHYFAKIPTIAIFIVMAMSGPLGVLLFILKGIDNKMLKEEQEAARARGDREVLLHAQSSAAAFYRRAGFVAQGEPFDEVGIAHITMVLGL